MTLEEIIRVFRNTADNHLKINGFYTGMKSEQNNSNIEYPCVRVSFPYTVNPNIEDDLLTYNFKLMVLVNEAPIVTSQMSYEINTNFSNQDNTLNEIDADLVNENLMREKALKIMAQYVQGLIMAETSLDYFKVVSYRCTSLERYANDMVTGIECDITIQTDNPYKCQAENNEDFEVWKDEQNGNFGQDYIVQTVCTPTPFPTDCQTILDNLTQDIRNNCLLKTYDFSDTTVQAALEPQQTEDLLDYTIPFIDFANPDFQNLFSPTQVTDMQDWVCTGSTPTYTQYSMSFDGGNEYINLYDKPEYNFTNLQPFSITSWVKSNNYSTTFQGVVTKRSGTAGGTGWSFYFYLGDLYVLLQVGVFYIQVKTNGVSFINGTWCHVACTIDGSSQASGVKIYRDGVQLPTTITQNTLASSIVNNSPVIIGGENALAMYFNGKIGYSRLFNVELSSTDILDDYNGGTMLETSLQLVNQVLGWKSGQGGLCAINDWLFPNELDTTQAAPYSTNMQQINRTTDIP